MTYENPEQQQCSKGYRRTVLQVIEEQFYRL